MNDLKKLDKGIDGNIIRFTNNYILELDPKELEFPESEIKILINLYNRINNYLCLLFYESYESEYEELKDLPKQLFRAHELAAYLINDWIERNNG